MASPMVPGTMRPWRSTGRRRRSGNWPAIGGSGRREALEAGRGADPIWPDDLEPHFTGDQQFAIARTAADGEHPEVKEVEALFLDHDRSAQRFIYAENQYFASRVIAEAIARGCTEPDPPGDRPRQSDPGRRLARTGGDGRGAGPTGAGRARTPAKPLPHLLAGDRRGADIYVHAKIMIVDDRILRVGSANMNNRSLGPRQRVRPGDRGRRRETEAIIAGVRRP